MLQWSYSCSLTDQCTMQIIYIKYRKLTCLQRAVNRNTEKKYFSLNLNKACYITNFPSRKMPETNPGILQHPAKWNALHQYFLAFNDRFRKPYLITLNILKSSFNDNEIIWRGSEMHATLSKTECFGKRFNSGRHRHLQWIWILSYLKNHI